MYPITNPREGQRISLQVNRYRAGKFGTITQVHAGNKVEIWVDGESCSRTVHVSEIGALIPGNDDGYFDGPAGYAVSS